MIVDFDGRSDTPAEEPKLIELFKLGGDIYTVPEELPAGKVLAFMQEARIRGPEAAGIGLLIDMIGAGTYRRLVDLPPEKLRKQDLKAIIKVVSDIAMGAMEDVTGK